MLNPYFVNFYLPLLSPLKLVDTRTNYKRGEHALNLSNFTISLVQHAHFYCSVKKLEKMTICPPMSSSDLQPCAADVHLFSIAGLLSVSVKHRLAFTKIIW